MSHYERRLQHDLDEIRRRVAGVGVRVEDAIRFAVHALVSGDSKLANDIAINDLAINRATRDIDRQCHAFVAQHLPSAGHLRFVSSVLRLTVFLERIGDHAVTIARESQQLSGPLTPEMGRDIELMADQARSMLHQAMQAWNEENAELARGTKGMADQVEKTQHLALNDLLSPAAREGRGMLDTLAIFVVFSSLERVSDQAKNICEETVFTLTGQTKPPKVYKVLFVDGGGDGLSAMAQAIAAKLYPNSGAYSCAGVAPAGAFAPALVATADRLGLTLSGEGPTALPATEGELSAFHVIVGLEAGLQERLPRVPFHTAYLEWDRVSFPVDAAGEAASSEALDTLYRELAHDVGELMVKLRGEGAS